MTALSPLLIRKPDRVSLKECQNNHQERGRRKIELHLSNSGVNEPRRFYGFAGGFTVFGRWWHLFASWFPFMRNLFNEIKEDDTLLRR